MDANRVENQNENCIIEDSYTMYSTYLKKNIILLENCCIRQVWIVQLLSEYFPQTYQALFDQRLKGNVFENTPLIVVTVQQQQNNQNCSWVDTK